MSAADMTWQECRTEWDGKNKTTLWHNYPKEEGYYRVLVAGDSDYADGIWVIYDFPDYETWGFVSEVFEDTGEVSGGGVHDEEWESVIAWYGPIQIPKRSEEV